MCSFDLELLSFVNRLLLLKTLKSRFLLSLDLQMLSQGFIKMLTKCKSEFLTFLVVSTPYDVTMSLWKMHTSMYWVEVSVLSQVTSNVVETRTTFPIKQWKMHGMMAILCGWSWRLKWGWCHMYNGWFRPGVLDSRVLLLQRAVVACRGHRIP